MKRKLNTQKNHPKYLPYKRGQGDYWMCLLWMIFLVSSCSDEKVYRTDHPTQGQIILTTNWDISPPVSVPENYIVAVNDFQTTLNSYGVATSLGLFDPGLYNIRIYHHLSNLTISGTTASVHPVSAPSGKTGTFIGFLPKLFATAVYERTVQMDRDHHDTIVVHQQARELTLRLNITGDLRNAISSIEGVLGGVASQLDFSTGALFGNDSIPLVFGHTSGTYYEVNGFLLGIALGQKQFLSGKLKFTEDVPDQTFNIDLTNQFSGFNNNKKDPFLPPLISIETSANPTSPNVGSTIDPWDEKNHTIDY